MNVSIIMPVYNKEKYLDKSIKSILDQTYENFELIIINDGSTDNSSYICHRFEQEDSRIKVIDIENNGVSNARNIGIKNANGQYVQFIDGDDYVDEDMIERLVNLSEKYNTDIIITAIKKIDLKLKKSREVVLPFSGLKSVDDMMDNFAQVQKETGIYGCVSNKFIRKSIIDKYNLKFDKKLWLAEDLDFYLELYKYVTNVYFCNKSYYSYVQETENSSTTSNKKHDYLQQAEIILKEKEMLNFKNALNENNLNVVNSVITDFIMSYIHQRFDYNYKHFIKDLDVIIRNDKFMSSIDCNSSNKFTNKIMKLLLKYKKTSIYILFFTRTLLRDIYRKIKK